MADVISVLVPDFNAIVTSLLNESKKAKVNSEYKTAYLDGVLDFYNLMKKSVEPLNQSISCLNK